ncbi:MAG: MBOAT family protein [Clostridia bacterium]|nr:MBOAT family protein [Clostridia bacterium]
MLFSSLIFIYVFLFALIICYFLFARRNNTARLIVLTVFSLIFYAFGEPVYVFLMIGVVLVNYIFGFLCASDGEPGKKQKLFLALAIVLNLGCLGFFKYTNFFITNINAVAGTDVALIKVVMPIGISFFTFQAMSYVIDVYRGVSQVQRSFLKLLMYVSFFPQLIAGPIVRYQDIEDQLQNQVITAEHINDGIFRFALGAAKKVVIADTCYYASEGLFNADGGPFVLAYWAGVLFCFLQIYFDFSGYSDMAIGLGKIFGFDFPENFDYPYASTSIAEFWRRWHISLGTWFKDYLFYPVLKSRAWRSMTKKMTKSGHKKLAKYFPTILASFIVWLATGFWHGANWNFIIWGLWYWLFQALELLFLDKLFAKLPKVLYQIAARIYFFAVVLIGTAIFFFENNTFTRIGYLFGAGTSGFTNIFANATLLGNSVLMVVAFVLCFPIIPWLYGKARAKFHIGADADRIIKTVAAVAMLTVATVRMVGNTYSPFLYFRF